MRLAGGFKALAAASAGLPSLGSPGGLLKGPSGGRSRFAGAAHSLARAARDPAALGGYVGIQAALHRLDPRQPQRLRAALPRSPFHDRERAQKDLCLGLFGSRVGAFRLWPALRALARPFSVKPAPRLAGSFSPRPTESEGKSRLSLGIARTLALGLPGRRQAGRDRLPLRITRMDHLADVFRDGFPARTLF